MIYKINSLEYNVNIVGSGPPLLLLHGFTGSLATWDPFIPKFSTDYMTISVDLMGHGQTDAPTHPERYSIENAADDLVELLNQLNVEKCHLLGYSMGGRLALMLACRYPARIQSLMLESSSPGLKTDRERRERVESDAKLANFIEQAGIEAFIHHWENIPLFQTQKRVRLEEKARLRSLRLQNSIRGLANSLRGMGTGAQPSLWTCLPTLSMPILLITGALDTKYVSIAKQIDEQVKRAKLAIVDDAGHTVHFEKKDRFSKLVLDFLHQFKEELF